jgi:hypothetical protein
MRDKFHEVPLDEETKVTFRHEITLGPYAALHEKWLWDGITAESIIFDKNDIIDHSAEEIVALVQRSGVCHEGTDITLKSESGFTFVNFNFAFA